MSFFLYVYHNVWFKNRKPYVLLLNSPKTVYSMKQPPCSRVLLEKLTGLQLVTKFPTFYGTWRFITTFKSACHLFLSGASSIWSIPPHPTSLRSILILSSIYTWVSQVVPYPQVSPPKPWIRLSSPPYLLHAPPISFFLTQNIKPYFIREWKWAKFTTFSVPIFKIWTSLFIIKQMTLSVFNK